MSTAWHSGDIILGQYEVLDMLGEGGMGTVYKVHHRGWNVDLAVKSPKPNVLIQAGGEENVRREAETWVNLGLHPHVVSCYYMRTLDEIPRVFAEYMAGGSLSDWIRTRKLYEGGTSTQAISAFAPGSSFTRIVIESKNQPCPANSPLPSPQVPRQAKHSSLMSTTPCFLGGWPIAICLSEVLSISRHHFLVEVNPPNVRLRDLESLHGTYVNGQKHGGREKDETPEEGARRQYPQVDLHNGDEIKVGQTVFRMSIEVAANAAALPIPSVPCLSIIQAAS